MTDAGSNRVVLVMTTVPGDEEGRRIARLLVESRLAACVQILPPMTSIYRWESRLEEAAEQLLLQLHCPRGRSRQRRRPFR